MVEKCPEYVQDTRIKEIDPDGANALVERVLQMAADDFIEGMEETAMDVEAFLRSKISGVYGIENPEIVIQALRKKRKKYQEEKKRKREEKRLKEEMML